MKILPCFFILCLSLSSFSQTKSDSLTIEKAISWYRISNPRISPDEKRIAFVVTEPIKGSSPPNSDIWMYEIETKKLFQFTWSPKSDNNPKWSPDSRSLAFLSSRGGESQIHLMTLNGGEAVAISKSKTSIKDFEWSPDGKTIAYLAPEPATEEEQKKTKDQDDETVVHGEKPTRLWTLDVETQTASQKSSQPWEISEMKWTPGGQSILLITHTLPKAEIDIPVLGQYTLRENNFTVIKSPKHPAWRGIKISPDGKTIGYRGPRVDGPSPHDLFLQSLETGNTKNISSTALDLPVSDYKFLNDGNILLTAQKGFTTRFFIAKTDGSIKPYSLDQNIGVSDRSSSGTIAFTSFTNMRPEELWLALPGQAATQVTNLNTAFDNFHFIKPEFLYYKSFDGTMIEGSFYKPENVKGAIPLVVLVHGGPTGAWTDSYYFWNQLFLARGYAVFCPNVRGSTGYGWKFLEMNKNDWGGGDFKDVMAGVDFLTSRGGLDATRVGIAGWSYGGYMTMWAVTQTNRFKAAMAGAGLSDLASEYGTEDNAAYDGWFFGTPYENLSNFTKSSPVTFVKNAKTPTLIIQGEKDPVDPVGQSQQFYRGLRHYGVTTELVLYPRELHGFTEEKHIVDYTKRMLDWFDKYLK
jgi:dipeptidyl aminopeptidase/acylaminoacyl peptidase